MTRAAWGIAIVGLLGCAPGGSSDPDTDDTSPPALGPDVEGVASREVDLTLAVASANGEADGELDVNGDGVADFGIELSRATLAGESIWYVALAPTAVGNEILVADVRNDGSDGTIEEAARVLQLGERIEGSSTRWEPDAVLHEIETFEDEVEDDYGVAGDGRVLLGVRFLTGISDLLNGWIEVSVDEELTTVTVYRAGWAELPELGVGAGDR